MELVSSVAELPLRPAVYAIWGGTYPPRQYAYIGIGERLRVRVRQPVILRDSSVTTEVAVAGLRVERVRGIVWWEHPLFTLDKPAGSVAIRPALEAAERIAQELFRPTLRSRGTASAAADRFSAMSPSGPR